MQKASSAMGTLKSSKIDQNTEVQHFEVDMQEFKDNYATGFLKLLHQQFEEKSMTDYTIILDDGQELKCHKCILFAKCQFFKTMFTCQFEDSKSDRVSLEYLNPVCLKAVIEYLYTGKIKIEWSQMQDLVEIANYLGIEDILQSCDFFIKWKVCSETVEYWYKISRSRNLPSVKKCIETEYLAELCLTEEFRSLSLEEVKDIISNDRLNAPEQTVLNAALAWWVGAQNHLTDPSGKVFDCVRFSLLKKVTFDEWRERFNNEMVQLLPDSLRKHLWPDFDRNNDESFKGVKAEDMTKSTDDVQNNNTSDCKTEKKCHDEDNEGQETSASSQTAPHDMKNLPAENHDAQNDQENRPDLNPNVTVAVQHGNGEGDASSKVERKKKMKKGRRLPDRKRFRLMDCRDEKERVWFIGLGKQQWKDMTHVPYRVIAGTMCLTFRGIIVSGGRKQHNSDLCYWEPGEISDACELFDIDTLEWSTLPKMIGRRVGHKCEVVSGKMYVIGGKRFVRSKNEDSDDEDETSPKDEFKYEDYQSEVLCLNLHNMNWTVMAQSPVNAEVKSTLTVNNDIFVLSTKEREAHFHKFDIDRNRWITLPKPPGKFYDQVAMINHKDEDLFVACTKENHRLYIHKYNVGEGSWTEDVKTDFFHIASGDDDIDIMRRKKDLEITVLHNRLLYSRPYYNEADWEEEIDQYVVSYVYDVDENEWTRLKRVHPVDRRCPLGNLHSTVLALPKEFLQLEPDGEDADQPAVPQIG